MSHETSLTKNLSLLSVPTESFQSKTERPLFSISYADTFPSKPPYVSGLVIAILAELETRIPPLDNITMGVTNHVADADSYVDIWTRNGRALSPDNYSKELMTSMSSHLLIQILQLFFSRLEAPLFLCKDDLCSIVVSSDIINSYLKKTDDNVAVINSINNCCFKLKTNQLATLTYLMEKMHLWTQRQLLYCLKTKSTTSTETFQTNIVAFIARLFGPCVIGLSKTFLTRNSKKNFRNMPMEKDDLKTLVFTVLMVLPTSHYWHILSAQSLCSALEYHSDEKQKNPNLEKDHHWL